jgi:hypothetical protein
MTSQRARAAESRVRNKSSNGPRRVRRKCGEQSISQRRAHVSCRGYGSILQAHGNQTVNQGGTADKDLFVLDREYISVRDFFLGRKKNAKCFSGGKRMKLTKRWRGASK